MYISKLRSIALAFIIAILIIFTLAGCGDDNNNNSSGADTDRNQVTESYESSEALFSEHEIITSEESFVQDFSFVISDDNISEDDISFDENYEVDYQDSIVVIADGLLLGGYQDGVWRQDYTYGELLSYPKYYNYDKLQFLGEQNFLAFPKDETILSYDKSIEAYADQIDEYTSKYTLPIKVKGRAATIALNDYNPYVDDHTIPYKTNSSHISLPRTVTKIETITDEMTAAVRTILDENGLTKAPVSITEVYECDLEGNGVVSQIITAYTLEEDLNNMSEEEINSQNGSYTLCITMSNGNINIVSSSFSPFNSDDFEMPSLNHFHCISSSLYDINDNGDFEIILSHGYWESSSHSVSILNSDGKWKEVLYVNCGY